MQYGWTFVHSMKGKIEHEEHVISCHEKINSFEMFPHESANYIYSFLNVLVYEVNGLGFTQLS